MQTFFVGLSSWIIQDGNYGDFAVGDEAEFAEFYPHSMRLSRRRERACEPLSGNRYRIRGQVVYTDRSAYVVDFGIMAFWNQAPPKFAAKEAGSRPRSTWASIRSSILRNCMRGKECPPCNTVGASGRSISKPRRG